MGSQLRNYKKTKRGVKLADGKVVGRKNRLTDKIIDKIQKCYGQSIKGNKGDLEGMRKAINAILHHIVQYDTKPMEEQHCYCPKDSESWCN